MNVANFIAALVFASSLTNGQAADLRARELFYKNPPPQAQAKKPTVMTSIGLKYKLLRSVGGGPYQPVSSISTFDNGDRLQLVVEANMDSYLYVVSKGTSGAWKLQFPARNTNAGDNRVQRAKEFPIPGRFTFEGEPGTEKLFLILSRQPEKDLDGIIYKLSGGAAATAGKEPRQMAANIGPIDDALIDRVRGDRRSRDLVFEQTDDVAYVVNPASTADARLYADITLKHR